MESSVRCLHIAAWVVTGLWGGWRMSEVLGTPQFRPLQLPPVQFNLRLSLHLPPQNWQHLTETWFSKLLCRLPDRRHWGSGCSTAKTTYRAITGRLEYMHMLGFFSSHTSSWVLLKSFLKKWDIYDCFGKNPKSPGWIKQAQVCERILASHRNVLQVAA